MRVLLTGVAIEGGGAERVVADLAAGLARAGHEVLVAFLEGTDDIVPQLEAEGVHCVRLLARREFAPSAWADFTPQCILQFRDLYRCFRPDIVHAHLPRATLWAALAKQLFNRTTPFVYTEHNVQEVYPGWSRWLFRCFLPAVDHVICVSEAGRRSFVGRWAWPEGGVSTIWNGIDPARLAYVCSAGDTTGVVGDGSRAPTVLNVGNLTHRKAQDLLVAAMALVRQDGFDAACWIAGSPDIDPSAAAVVSRAISEHSAGGYVKLLGARHDVPELLAACDAFALSSRQEGFPITILEAMAAGKPVIATDVGGCAEAVVHGETGLIVQPENPAALARAIEYVLSHPDEARRMGEAGRRRVAEHFTVETMVCKHLAVYEALLACSSR